MSEGNARFHAAVMASGDSAAAKAFDIAELVEQILLNVDCDCIEVLFALQRVNSVFNNVIKSSKALQRRMHLQDAGEDEVEQQNQAILFESWTKSDKLMYRPVRYYTSSARAKAPKKQVLVFEYRVRDEEQLRPKQVGFKGVSRLHNTKEASWRRIKLSSLGTPVTVRVDTCVEIMQRGSWRTYCGAEGGLWYSEDVTMNPKQATLGATVDISEEVLNRRNDEHMTLVFRPPAPGRRFGQPLI